MTEVPPGAPPPPPPGPPPPPSLPSSPPPGEGPRPRRFDGRFVALGVLLGVVLPFVLLPLSGLLEFGVPAGLAFLAALLAPPVVGTVFAVRRGTPARRGLGLGVLIGWAALLVVGAGLCVALLAAYQGG